MIELTNELKARFFAQYWGQRVEITSDFDYRGVRWCNGDTAGLDSLCMKNPFINNSTLCLKPLSLITDEDAIEVSSLCNSLLFDKSVQNIKKHTIIYALTNTIVYQYLQSKGYALPFMGISVEELINAGWIKLSNS